MAGVMGSGLIGRDSELEELARAVAKNRLVSMTGAPGVGKTALAAAFAESRASVQCALFGAEGADATSRAIARALGLPQSATASAAETAERIGRAFASRGKILVVLDDADLARGALAKLLPGWLRDAPSARFLVAARTRVALSTAQRFELGPLEIPGAISGAREQDRDAVERCGAVRLFVRCAAAVRPGYRLTAAATPHVAAIVRTLGGLPLAIELCASRIVVLGEREIADMLAQRLDSLDAGSAAAGGRTLRGAFALSWDQLDEGDARILAACAVFRGSFDLDAATAVTGQSRLETADALERLEESSLVRAFEPAEMPGARRYVLQASVRVFAGDRRTRDERAETARRHAEHFGASAGAGAPPRPEMLALDRDDLEAALGWATEEERTAMAARVALALAPLVLARGPLVPFLERVDALLAARGLPRALSAELHLVRGLARIHHGRRDDALGDLVAARRLAVRAGTLRVEVLAASKLGLVLGLKGRFSEAKSHFDAATRRLDARSDPGLRGVVSKDLANVLSEEGRNAEAMVELARARDLFHVAGDLREEGFVLMMLGSRLLDDGQLVDARRDCMSGLERLRAAGDHRSTRWCEVLLALVDEEEGDLLAARTRLDGALASFRAIGDAHTEGIVLGYLGNVALEQGALADADASYRDARMKLAEVGDRGSEAMVTAGAGVVDIALGRSASARERFARANELLERDGRAARREAVAVLASLLERGSKNSGAKDAAPKDAAPKDTRAKDAAPKDDRGGASATSEEVRFARRVVAKVRSELAPRRASRARTPPADELVIAADGSWLRTPSGETAKFAQGGALRGILRKLGQDRIRYPGRPMTLGALVRAGWPGESILPAAAKNRLHVTIARLRRAGLEGVLVHDDDGYLLDPAVPARVADDGERPRRSAAL
jgi:predicted ATPase